MFGDLSLFAGLVTQLGVVHLTLGEVGIILSVHRLVRIPGNLVVGSLQDRFGRRPLFVLGMLLAVLSTAAYGLVSGFWPFVLARVAWGAAWALINVCGMTMTLDLKGPADRGSLVGFYNAWIWVGYFIGPLAGSLLTDALSFQRAMLDRDTLEQQLAIAHQKGQQEARREYAMEIAHGLKRLYNRSDLSNEQILSTLVLSSLQAINKDPQLLKRAVNEGRALLDLIAWNRHTSAGQ